MQNFFSEENVQLKQSLDEKIKALDLLIQEHQTVKSELEQALTKLKAAEDENQNLVDRWMLEKMKDAERLNEVPYFPSIAKIAGLQYVISEIRDFPSIMLVACLLSLVDKLTSPIANVYSFIIIHNCNYTLITNGEF